LWKGQCFFPQYFSFHKNGNVVPKKTKPFSKAFLKKMETKQKIAIKTSLTSGNNHGTQCRLSHDGWELQNVICQKGFKYLKLIFFIKVP
jgi:hypothetical protein